MNDDERNRLSTLETVISTMSSKFDVFVSNMSSHIEGEQKKSDKILEQTTLHNGRMKSLELWQARIQGGRSALGVVWSVLVVFVIASIFGMFRMYVEFQSVKQILLKAEVASQLQDYYNNK